MILIFCLNNYIPNLILTSLIKRDHFLNLFLICVYCSFAEDGFGSEPCLRIRS